MNKLKIYENYESANDRIAEAIKIILTETDQQLELDNAIEDIKIFIAFEPDNDKQKRITAIIEMALIYLRKLYPNLIITPL